MEERRTNKHGLGSVLSIRRDNFWHFTGILCFCAVTSVYSNKISIQLTGTLTHPFVHADPTSGSTGPSSSLSSRLSPTAVNSSLLLTVLVPCLSSSSFGLVGNLARKPFAWVSRVNRRRNPLTGTHPHLPKRMHPRPSWHKTPFSYLLTSDLWLLTVPAFIKGSCI